MSQDIKRSLTQRTFGVNTEAMKVVANNCVSTIEIPSKIAYATGFDYNPVLNLFATFNYEDALAVWNPVSGKVVAEWDDYGENNRDTLFLPGDRVAVSSSERLHGGHILIFKLAFGEEKSEPAKFEEDEVSLEMSYPGAITLTPTKNLLVTADPLNGREGVYEVFMDWDNGKILKSREIIPAEDEEIGTGISLLCCSQDFEVTTFVHETSVLSTAKVSFNSKGEVQLGEQRTITYYTLDGEEKKIGHYVCGLLHDGENLIISNEDEIVLLESMTEGSNAHLIASDINPSGHIKINSEGEIMVCEETVIKLFEYKFNPRSLQALCRRNIRKIVHADYHEKVNSWTIPDILKHYLLYK